MSKCAENIWKRIHKGLPEKSLWEKGIRKIDGWSTGTPTGRLRVNKLEKWFFWGYSANFIITKDGISYPMKRTFSIIKGAFTIVGPKGIYPLQHELVVLIRFAQWISQRGPIRRQRDFLKLIAISNHTQIMCSAAWIKSCLLNILAYAKPFLAKFCPIIRNLYPHICIYQIWGVYVKQICIGERIWMTATSGNTGWPKKPHTILLSISLLNIDRFS